MKRWIVMGGLVLALTAVLLVAFACIGAELVTTEDIDVILDPANQRLDNASFIPGVSRDTVVAKARDSAGDVIENKDISDLEIRSTVGLYTGLNGLN